MRITRAAATTAVVITVFATAACGEGDPESAPSVGPSLTASSTPTQPTTEPSEPPTSEPPPMESMSQNEIQKVLSKAWLSPAEAAEHGMSRDTEYDNELGLGRPTNDYCGDDRIHKSDKLRLARAQRWWISNVGQDDSWHRVGHEIVLFEPGGAQAYLDGLAGTPKRCKTVEFDDGGGRTWSKSSGPDGLIADATVIKEESTFDSGTSTGYTVAVVAGDIVGICYVDTTSSTTTDQLTVDLVKRLAKKVKNAQEKLAPTV